MSLYPWNVAGQLCPQVCWLLQWKKDETYFWFWVYAPHIWVLQKTHLMKHIWKTRMPEKRFTFTLGIFFWLVDGIQGWLCSLWISILLKEIMLFVYLSFVVATHENSVREVHLLCGGNPVYQPLPAYDPALCLPYPQLCFQLEFDHNTMTCLYTSNHRCVFVHIFRKNLSGHPNTPSSFPFESSSPWPWSRPAACSSCWFQREPIEPPSCGLLISPRVTQELICSVGRNKIPSRHAFIPTIHT